MASSGVGQFSINVKSNLRDFYGDLTKAKRTMKELTDRKNQLQIDSSQLDKLRDKSQRIAAEMRELRQQKTEIKLGMKNVENADEELKKIDQRLASLNRQKLEVDADIQPIRTANVELYKTEQEIDRLNGKKVEVDFGNISGGLDDLSNKILGVIKALGSISLAGLTGAVGILKEAVNAASDLEQNTGGVNKLFGDSAEDVVKNSKQAYKTAGISQNEYLEQATSFSASLITSLKGDQAKAAKYVDKALVDMSDNVNTFGTNAGLVQNAYEGFAKGNYTMLDNLKLGFGGNQTGAMDLVNSYGKLDHKVTDISEVTFPLLIESIHNAQKAMNISGTTAKEAATTYEGSFKMMKGAWNDFMATGDPSHLADSVPVYLENLDKKLKDLTPKIIEGVKKLAKELPPKLKPVIEDIKKILTESLDSIFGKGTVDNFVKGMKPFTDIIKKVFDMLSKSTKGEKPDLSWVGSVIPDLLKLAFGLKAASVVFKGISFAKKIGLKFPSFKGLGSFGKSTKEFKAIGIEDLKSLGMKMLTVAGISANIYLAAKALQQVQKIGDLGNLQPKMLAIAEAVSGMGLIAAAIGFINEKKPDMLISGLAIVALISADVWLVAKALQKVEKIDSDFGSIQSKIGQIALCTTEMGVLALAVGAFMSTGIGAVTLISGLITLVSIAGTLVLVAKAVSYLGNLEIDKETIKNNIEAISDTIGAITLISLDQNLIAQIATLVKQIIDLAIITTLLTVGFELQALQNIELDQEKVETNIKTIQKCLSHLSNIGEDTSFTDLIEKVHEFLSNLIDIGIIAEFIVIAHQLEGLQDVSLDEDKISGNIKIIKNLIASVSSGSLVDLIKNFWSGSIKTGALAPALAIFKELISIGHSLEEIQGLEIVEKSLTEKINIIKNAINSISSFATDDIVNNLTGLADALDIIIEKLTSQFPPEFNELGQLLAKKTNEGFKNKLDLQTALSQKINSLSAAGASGAGAKIANAINSSLKNNLTIGDTIRNAIKSALEENYSTTINVDIITNKIEKTTSTKSKSKKSKITKAGGGIVSVKTDQVVLQDSPEKPLLDNGEYVIPEKVVSALGVPFLEKLRSGRISKTFAGLAQSVSNTTSNIVNNVYNNNTQNLNLYTTGNEDFILQANRRFRKA